MEHTMLTWNIPNWITVILMVALGYLVVSLAAQLVKGRLGMKGSNDNGSILPGSISDFMGLAA